MKTNHQRGFKAKKDSARWRGFRGTHHGSPSQGSKSSTIGPVSGRATNAKWFGIPDGPKDAAKANRGAKKFERTRFRTRENAATRKLASSESDE